MQYTSFYDSPLGGILLISDGDAITGLWFEGEKPYAGSLTEAHESAELSVFDQTKRWLDLYFSGIEPDFDPKLKLDGTPFQIAVWNILEKIPYGATVTYGEIAKQIAKQKGIAKMSAQAVGGAVGHNRISILIPCHRVVGTSGSLTGYGGGMDRKVKLLTLETVDLSNFFLPKQRQ